ncbi:unnamed protein product [Amoebophrya sp. A25]|nr:unnamed protein product [Amoebophrya sp. A25]|eukprot:GSA25T00016362001.1
MAIIVREEMIKDSSFLQAKDAEELRSTIGKNKMKTAIKWFLRDNETTRDDLGMYVDMIDDEPSIKIDALPQSSSSIQKLPPSHQIDYSDSTACIIMLLVLLGIFLLRKVAREMRIPRKDTKNKTGDAKSQRADDYGTLAGTDAVTEV